MEHKPKLNKLIRTKMRVVNHPILFANEQIGFITLMVVFFCLFRDKIFNSYMAYIIWN